MSEHDLDTTFGPSSPRGVNVTAGNTASAKALNPSWAPTDPGGAATLSGVVDVNRTTGPRRAYSDNDLCCDACRDSNHSTDGSLVEKSAENIGDLLVRLCNRTELFLLRIGKWYRFTCSQWAGFPQRYAQPHDASCRYARLHP